MRSIPRLLTLVILALALGCSSMIGGPFGIRIHDDWDEPPEVIHFGLPEYPLKAREEHIEGAVDLAIVVDKKGRVVEAEIISSTPIPDFGPAALEAILQWRYSPATKNGRPVAIRVRQRIEFTLKMDLDSS